MALPPQFAAKVKEHIDAGHSPSKAFAKAMAGAAKKCPEDGTALVGGKCPKCGWHAEPDADDKGGPSDNDQDNG